MVVLVDGGWPRYAGSWSAVALAIDSLAPDPCYKPSTAAAAVSATYAAGVTDMELMSMLDLPPNRRCRRVGNRGNELVY